MTKTFDFTDTKPATGKLNEYKLTDEQVAVVSAFASGDDLNIQAGAGAGKTSTLREAAKSRSNRRGVALSYNKAIATDMERSFPTNVKCSTAHALAFAPVGKYFRHRIEGPRMPTYIVARKLGITEGIEFDAEHKLTVKGLARLVMETIQKFSYSDDFVISKSHVPAVNGMTKEQRQELVSAIVPMARDAWLDIESRNGELPFTHDNYLKIWQLEQPRIFADFVMLDEAQDANPVIASIVNAQRCQKILVGDSNQAIYGWRGAVDAMENFEGKRLYLTQSFRFGPAVADEANKFLALLGSDLRITGFDAIKSRVDALSEPRAILTRTNAGSIVNAQRELLSGRKVALVGGGNAIAAFARAADELRMHGQTEHPELCMFTSWDELVEYIKEDAAGSDLKVLVKLIDEFGTDAVLDIVNALVDERDADVIVSTAHKSKGREWDTVQIASDFAADLDKNGLPSREELMLDYVAVTRAKKVLDLGGLSWVEAL